MQISPSMAQSSGWTQIDGSFWINAFVRGSNGHDYYIASHLMSYASDIEGSKPLYRASVLDLTHPATFDKYDRIAPENTTFWTGDGDFRANFEDYGMESIDKNPLRGLHTYSSAENVDFDFDFFFTSPILLNAALGSYQVGGGLGWEWSVPRGRTEGSFKVDGEKVDIVPEKSFTWYDRQFGSLQDSFDWIMLHFDESDWLDISLMCAWKWEDRVDGQKMFATVRNSLNGRDSVVPINLTASTTDVWISPDTGLEYPQVWIIQCEDTKLLVTSPRPDQVIEADDDTGFPSQFSGYVDVVATKSGSIQSEDLAQLIA
ncbi:short-chain dehydrogenase [Fusarium subglutinans]|uniref:Short-chain dehydrogenase n=1 Tax=Gibberella subglutinans TaxID=42677 RepID=A0A8H5PBZ9_GIBSU|nr:short-chain dehydrogenase [Fusarium subglutinans]KAF5593880.1 short-chain dehydrogenase [Fusarium subglutinans]